MYYKFTLKARPPKIARPIRSGRVSGAQTLLRILKYRARCYDTLRLIVF